MLAPARSPLDRRGVERRGQGAKQTARGRHAAGSRRAAGVVVHDGPRIDREVTPRPLGGDHEGARPG